MQNVSNGRSIEVGGGGGAASVDEREIAREGLDGSDHSISARAAKLDEILWRDKGDQ